MLLLIPDMCCNEESGTRYSTVQVTSLLTPVLLTTEGAAFALQQYNAIPLSRMRNWSNAVVENEELECGASGVFSFCTCCECRLYPTTSPARSCQGRKKGGGLQHDGSMIGSMNDGSSCRGSVLSLWSNSIAIGEQDKDRMTLLMGVPEME